MRKGFRFLSVLLAIAVLLSVSLSALAAPADQAKTSNRFNVVFVIDASTSMNNSDPDNLRFGATTLFLSLLANNGNRVGSVVFSTDIKQVTDLREVTGKDDKLFVEDKIEGIPAKGYTATGDALKKATEMLESQGDPNNKSVILLLSDGCTDLPTQGDIDKCNQNRDIAVEQAKDKGIKIYTVGLNVNDGMRKEMGEMKNEGKKPVDGIEELTRIAKSTDGVFQPVESASDLSGVFQAFYSLIYGSETVPVDEFDVPASGKIEKEFTVPNAGVEEVNIIINSKNQVKNITLEHEDGTVLSSSEVESMTMTTPSFSITKVVKPKGGNWTLKADGAPGDTVKIDMIYNDNLSIELDCDTKNVTAKTKLPVHGYLLEEGQRAGSGYADYAAKLYVSYSNTADGTPSKEEYTMEPQSSAYYFELPIDDIGHYELYMEVTGNGTYKDTSDNVLKFDVGNQAPEVKEDVARENKIEQTIWFIPFLTKDYEIPFAGAIVDPEEGENLTYTVSFSSFKDTSYEIDGKERKVIIKDFLDLSMGRVTVRGTDSMGAYAEFDVVVTIINVGVIAIIVIVAAAIIVAGVIALLIFLLSRKKFMGTITVRNLETGAVMTQQKNKGHINLTAFQIGYTGFNKKACFQATGKSYIEFRTPTPVLTSSTVNKEKKIKILNRCEIEIYSDDTRTRGIAVTFESYLGY